MSAQITPATIRTNITPVQIKKPRASFKPGAIWRTKNGNEFRISRDGQRIFFAKQAGKRNVLHQQLIAGKSPLPENYLRALLNTFPVNGTGPARTWHVFHDGTSVSLALQTSVEGHGSVVFPLNPNTPSRGVAVEPLTPKMFYKAVAELLEDARRYEADPVKPINIETLRR